MAFSTTVPFISRQVRIVELISVDGPLTGNEFEIFLAEGMAVVGREVPKRRPVLAANLRLQLADGARKAVRGGGAAGQDVGFAKRAEDLLGLAGDDAVPADSVGHEFILSLAISCSTDLKTSGTAFRHRGKIFSACVSSGFVADVAASNDHSASAAR